MNLQPLIDATASYYQAQAFMEYVDPFVGGAIVLGIIYFAYKFVTFVVNDIRSNG